MVAENTYFPPGIRKSRSVAPCSCGRQSSAAGADPREHHQGLHGSDPVSSNSGVPFRKRDAATTIAGGLGEPTTLARTADVQTVATTGTLAGTPAHATTETELASPASTTSAASSSAPKTCFAGGCHVSTKVSSTAAGVPQREAAPAASVVRGTTACPSQKETVQNGDRGRPCTIGRQTEATYSLRGLKKLHVLPAGQRAENRQVFRVLKMFMKERKIMQPCMSFRVPLEVSSPTLNPPSRQILASEAEEAAGAAAHGSGTSPSYTVVPAPPPLPTCPVLSCCPSSSAGSSTRPTVALSSSSHSESSSAFCVPTSPVTSGSYESSPPRRPCLPASSSFSSSYVSSAAPVSHCRPRGFPPSDSSSLPFRSSCSCTSYSSSHSSSASFVGKRSPCSFCPCRSTTYVVVDCSPASGLLTAETVVYLSGAPLQRLRRVQLMALVHPNSAYGRRAGIASYQQVFKRRPDFPCLEQEDQLLLREAPVHIRDFERAVQTPEGPSTDAADLRETDATAATAIPADIDGTEDKRTLVARSGDVAVLVGMSPRNHKAAKDSARTGAAVAATRAQDREEKVDITGRAGRRESAPARGNVSKKLLYPPDAAAREDGDHEQRWRGSRRKFFHVRLSATETWRAGGDQIRCCSAGESGDAEDNAFAPNIERTLNASNEGASAAKHNFATSAADCARASAASAVTTLAAAGSAAADLGGGWSTGIAAATGAGLWPADLPRNSDKLFDERGTDDAVAERPNFLNCCVAQGSTDLHVCTCDSATTMPNDTTEECSVFQIQSVCALGNDNRSSSVHGRWAAWINKSSAHDSSSRGSSETNHGTCCCSGSSGSGVHARGTDVSSGVRNGSSASPRTGSSRSKSRGRNQTPTSHVKVISRRIDCSSGLSRSEVDDSSICRVVLCGVSAQVSSLKSTAHGVSREVSNAAYWEGSKEGSIGVAERAAADKWLPSAPAGSASSDLRPCKYSEGDRPQQIVHTPYAEPRTLRRVSRLQQYQRHTTCTQQRRRILQAALKEAAPPHCSKPVEQLESAFEGGFSRSVGEGRATTGDTGLKRTPPPRIGADEGAGHRHCTAGPPRTAEEEARLQRCEAEAVQRTTEDGAGFGGRFVRASHEEISFAGCTDGAARRQHTKGDAAAAVGAAAAGDAVQTRRTVAAGISVVGESAATERAITTGKGTAAGEIAAGGVAEGRMGRFAEREWRVRPTHEPQKVHLQRLDAETLFRFFVGPYLQRKLSKKSSTSEEEGRAERRHEEKEADRTVERRRVKGRVVDEGRRIGQGSGIQEGKRYPEDRATDEEEASQPRGTLVLYPGKELVIRDITFVVWAADPAGVPGLLDEDTVIYICLDPYGEYRRVHFVPFSDTLPTTYTFNFYEDYVKPFLLENKWRNFRRGDVFSYRGVEFKLIATEPSSSVGARVGPATVVYHEVHRLLFDSSDTRLWFQRTMHPTVMDVLPADVLYHIRRLPARMQPAAIIFAAQRLDPEVLMRVVPSTSALRSRRGLNEQAAEALREKLVHPFNFAAYLRKHPHLCCRVLPSTAEQSNEQWKASSACASVTRTHRHHSVGSMRNRAPCSGAAGAVGSNCVGKTGAPREPASAAPRDLVAETDHKEAVSAASAIATSGESTVNVRQSEEQATASVVHLVPIHAASRRTRGPPLEGTCGDGPLIGTNSAFDSKEDACSSRTENRDENVSKFERPSCTVCTLPMEEGDTSILLFCGHVFHWQCIRLWLRYNSTCPNCRAEITELLQRHEDRRRRRQTDSDVEGQARGGTGRRENVPEEEGALWLVSTVRRWISTALFGTVQQ